MTFPDARSVFAMGAAPDTGSLWVQFVPFAIVLAIFYFIILLPMKRKQQKVASFLDSLKVNDRIVTTGGIYGLITKLGEQTVQVQVADKVRIEVAKASIGGYQGQEPVQDATGERGSQ
jgi:preprotein translocase subunit YajC